MEAKISVNEFVDPNLGRMVAIASVGCVNCAYVGGHCPSVLDGTPHCTASVRSTGFDIIWVRAECRSGGEGEVMSDCMSAQMDAQIDGAICENERLAAEVDRLTAEAAALRRERDELAAKYDELAARQPACDWPGKCKHQLTSHRKKN